MYSVFIQYFDSVAYDERVWLTGGATMIDWCTCGLDRRELERLLSALQQSLSTPSNLRASATVYHCRFTLL